MPRPPIAAHGFDTEYKYGHNPDIDAGGDGDVWDGGGFYIYPTTTAQATVVSTSDDDRRGDIGAREVEITGLNVSYHEIIQYVELDGTTPVVVPIHLRRVNRVRVSRAGLGPPEGKNVGTITVSHPGPSKLAQIQPGRGQTLMAVYTVPARNAAGIDFERAEIIKWGASLSRAGVTTEAVVSLWVRLYGEAGTERAWNTRAIRSITSSGCSCFDEPFLEPLVIDPKADVLVQVEDVGAQPTAVSANFALYLIRSGPLPGG